MSVPEDISNEINAPIVNRKYLVVAFDLQLQILGHVDPDIRQQLVEIFFTVGEDHQVISIPEVILYCFVLLHPVIEVGQIKISEVLTQVVPNWKAFGAVDDLIQEPKKILVLYLSPEKDFQNIMVDVGIEFFNIKLQAVLGC